jgi:hypothetical protein
MRDYLMRTLELDANEFRFAPLPLPDREPAVGAIA